MDNLPKRYAMGGIAIHYAFRRHTHTHTQHTASPRPSAAVASPQHAWFAPCPSWNICCGGCAVRVARWLLPLPRFCGSMSRTMNNGYTCLAIHHVGCWLLTATTMRCVRFCVWVVVVDSRTTVNHRLLHLKRSTRHSKLRRARQGLRASCNGIILSCTSLECRCSYSSVKLEARLHRVWNSNAFQWKTIAKHPDVKLSRITFFSLIQSVMLEPLLKTERTFRSVIDVRENKNKIVRTESWYNVY